MKNKELQERMAAAEGILFAAGEPLPVERICFALSIGQPEAEELLQTLADGYVREKRGIRLLRLEDKYQLCSAPDYAEQIRRALEIRRSVKLSQTALEVLTIIAYAQPTTRVYVEQVRGVDSAYTIGMLAERELIEECGRLRVAGRPRLYRTTAAFLRAFHLSSLDDLPPLPEGMRLPENPAAETVESDEGEETAGEETAEKGADAP